MKNHSTVTCKQRKDLGNLYQQMITRWQTDVMRNVVIDIWGSGHFIPLLYFNITTLGLPVWHTLENSQHLLEYLLKFVCFRDRKGERGGGVGGDSPNQINTLDWRFTGNTKNV